MPRGTWPKIKFSRGCAPEWRAGRGCWRCQCRQSWRSSPGPDHGRGRALSGKGREALRLLQEENWALLVDCRLSYMQTLPKAQRTRGLSSTYQSNFFGSYHKFKHKSWSNIFRISTLHQLQNLNQTSPFWQNLNLLGGVNCFSSSTSKSQPFRQNLNLKILTKPNQNLDQEWTS